MLKTLVIFILSSPAIYPCQISGEECNTSVEAKKLRKLPRTSPNLLSLIPESPKIFLQDFEQYANSDDLTNHPSQPTNID